MNDTEKITYIRRMMPVTQKFAYLNTGTAGPISQVMFDALHDGAKFDHLVGRGNFSSYKPSFAAMKALREAFGRLCGAPAETIALTHHTTDGMNIVTHGINWQRGDEIIMTNFEHQGGYIPAFVVRQRYGVEVRVVDLAFSDSAEEVLAKLEAAITPRTRLLSVSHVMWNTGLRLPLKELVSLAHRHNVLTLIDAAQSAGSVPLDLPASGVDFYAMPGQKWLCGPEGIGALYVRPDQLSTLHPTFVGFLSLKEPSAYDKMGGFMLAPSAKRYEVGSVYRPGYKAMVTNLQWIEEKIGWSWIYNRIEQMTSYAYQALASIPDVTLITPPNAGSGLITFNVGEHEPPRVMQALNRENVIIRYLGFPSALRASIGFYNNESDVKRLVDGVTWIASLAPDALPEYEPPY